MTHTSSPSKPKTINRLQHFAISVVIMLYILKYNNTNNYIFTVFALQINSRASGTPHITFLVVIQLLVSQIERRNRIGSTAFSGSLV